MTFTSDWDEIKAESPEAAAASMDWYIIPSRSDHALTGCMPYAADAFALPFEMCETAECDRYSHLDLAALAEIAAGRIHPRLRRLWRFTEPVRLSDRYPGMLYWPKALDQAFARGLEEVYALAGLTPAQTRVARYVMEGFPDEVIHDLMGYQDRATCGDATRNTRGSGGVGKLATLRARKGEVRKKLQAMLNLKEEDA